MLLIIAGLCDDVPARVRSGISCRIQGEKAKENAFSENAYDRNNPHTYLE